MTATVRRAVIADVPVIARVQVDGWRSTYEGIVPGDYLASLSYASREERWRAALVAPSAERAVFVAEEKGGIVGFASCGPERTNDPEYRGELYTMYVARSAQRRGIGRILCSAVANDLKGRGFESMLVWVLERNPSRRFYEVLGGKEVRSKEIVIGGKPLTEVGYGWKSLEPLIVRQDESGKGGSNLART